MKESIVYYIVKAFGFVIRCLPAALSLGIGKAIGLLAYYCDTKHKAQAYANIKMAFAQSKAPEEIRRITKAVFKNYGQNVIDLFRIPLITPSKFESFVKVEGKEHITESLKKGKGVIILPMHFGSWEMASLSCAMLGYPYKMVVKTQKKYSKLDELLNSYRTSGGVDTLARGVGTRDLVKSLNNNEVVGMVVDQGGKGGVLVPFFNRQASMSVGAIRMGLKRGVPICFSVIIREPKAQHRMVIHEPLELDNTGDLEKDIFTNLLKVTKLMEDYIRKYPAEYMWFYKIWKYSRQASITVLSDGKVGHLRQSESVTKLTQKILQERKIDASSQTIDVSFKNHFAAKMCSVLSFLAYPFLCQGRLQILKWVLTKECFQRIMSSKADFVISCGSSIAGVNYLLSREHNAKSFVVLKPGLLDLKRFDLVVLPQHDMPEKSKRNPRIAVTKAAPNLIDQDYLDEHSQLLLNRFSHLKSRTRLKIGLFIGGDSKKLFLSEQQMRVFIHQVREVAKEISADILATTSRRTPQRIEQLLFKELKKDENCPLLILANRETIPEAVGGILGLSDIVVVSGDSISMVSEAASSGKYTVVFTPQKKDVMVMGSNKHKTFIEQLNDQGFILSTNVKDIGQSIYGIAKNKIQTRKIDDDQIILEALRYVV